MQERKFAKSLFYFYERNVRLPVESAVDELGLIRSWDKIHNQEKDRWINLAHIMMNKYVITPRAVQAHECHCCTESNIKNETCSTCSNFSTMPAKPGNFLDVWYLCALRHSVKHPYSTKCHDWEAK